MSDNINIEEMMDEIRQNSKDRGYDKEPVSFEEIEIHSSILKIGTGYDSDEFMDELEFLDSNCTTSFHVPIAGGNPFSVFIKKVIRKMTRFIVAPLVDSQNAYNVSNVKCMNQISEFISEMEQYKTRIEQLEKELKELKKND